MHESSGDKLVQDVAAAVLYITCMLWCGAGCMRVTLRTVLGSPAFLAEVRPRVEPLRS